MTDGIYWPFRHDMASRFLILAGTCGLLLVGASGGVSARGADAPAQGALLDRLLTAYLDGDTEAIAKAFPRSTDFHQSRVVEARRFERWLGTWQRSKAALVLEMAETSTRVAPQFTKDLLESGRRYIATAEKAGEIQEPDRPFVRTWHRVAVALLQRAGQSDIAETYLAAVLRRDGSPAAPADPDPRLLLTRGTAIEQRCWLTRPMLDRPDTDLESLMQAVGMSVRDPHGPPKSVRDSQSDAHEKCLEDAAAQFTAARNAPETVAEARVRAGWILFQLRRSEDALASLQDVPATEDHEVAYWAALFRGRVLDGLRRYDDAAAAYREALGICPSAQSAVVGLSLSLFRGNQIGEADEVARTHRANIAAGADPWWTYPIGDARFIERWMTEIRGQIR